MNNVYQTTPDFVGGMSAVTTTITELVASAWFASFCALSNPSQVQKVAVNSLPYVADSTFAWPTATDLYTAAEEGEIERFEDAVASVFLTEAAIQSIGMMELAGAFFGQSRSLTSEERQSLDEFMWAELEG
jgi:hypothetical protein